MAARLAAHWLSFAPALLLAAVIGGALLNVEVAPLALGLAIGTPALAGLGLVAAALVAGARGGPGAGGALAGIIVLPLALPVLIFGSGGRGAAAGGGKPRPDGAQPIRRRRRAARRRQRGAAPEAHSRFVTAFPTRHPELVLGSMRRLSSNGVS